MVNIAASVLRISIVPPAPCALERRGCDVTVPSRTRGLGTCAQARL